MLDWLFDLMDLPENLRRALNVTDKYHGLIALVMAAVLLYLCWLMWPWLYYFDIESTAAWTQKALDTLAMTMANTGMPLSDAYRSSDGKTVGWFVSGTTYIPTIVELFAVAFAQNGIKVAHMLVTFFSTFDLVTDKDRVWAFVDGLGVTGVLGFALKIPMLILASFGFQSLFIIFLISAFKLLMNARSLRQPRAMAG